MSLTVGVAVAAKIGVNTGAELGADMEHANHISVLVSVAQVLTTRSYLKKLLL